MEKINAEIVISSLIKTGFDKIDPLLYSYTLAKIEESNIFEFEIDDYSEEFKKVVDTNTSIINLKIGADTNKLQSNDMLIKLINEIDYRDLVKEKMFLLFQFKNIENMNKLLSKREQKILYDEFEMDLIPNREKINIKKTH